MNDALPADIFAEPDDVDPTNGICSNPFLDRAFRTIECGVRQAARGPR